jgi:hypothetical protein
MLAKYILGALSAVFLILAVIRMAGSGGTAHPPSRTWFLIGVIFGAVSAWSFYRGF